MEDLSPSVESSEWSSDFSSKTSSTGSSPSSSSSWASSTWDASTALLDSLPTYKRSENCHLKDNYYNSDSCGNYIKIVKSSKCSTFIRKNSVIISLRPYDKKLN